MDTDQRNCNSSSRFLCCPYHSLYLYDYNIACSSWHVSYLKKQSITQGMPLPSLSVAINKSAPSTALRKSLSSRLRDGSGAAAALPSTSAVAPTRKRSSLSLPDTHAVVVKRPRPANTADAQSVSLAQPDKHTSCRGRLPDARPSGSTKAAKVATTKRYGSPQYFPARVLPVPSRLSRLLLLVFDA